MIRLYFDPPIDDQAWDSWIAKAEAAAQDLLRTRGTQRTFDASLYKEQRDRLLRVTNQKCAYCEISLPSGMRRGDVEHYRPKGSVRDRTGRRIKVIEAGVEVNHPGYYWLAYDYRNLLPCCPACNRRAIDRASGSLTGKSDIFPTLDDHWANVPAEVAEEKPALLNPWLPADDPIQHIEFDPATGRAIGLTERGRVTIEVLGLNRDNLPAERRTACINLKRDFMEYLTRNDPEARVQLSHVRSGASEFAAICRAYLDQLIVRQHRLLTGISTF